MVKITIVAAVVLTLFLSAVSFAHVELVTIPKRDSVQLTIYNSEDITLVKETRYITFKKGINLIQYTWAGTLIDPTSVAFRAIDNPDMLEILDTTFPANRPNALIWHIDAEEEGEYKVEIEYFTSGLTWTADYVGITDNAEKTMTLSGYVRVYNNSGEDYENAEVRLVVGKIHLVQKIIDLATGQIIIKDDKSSLRLGFSEAIEAYDFDVENGRLSKPKEIIKEGLSEYFIYTIEGTETIPNTWSKRMHSFTAKDVPFDIVYTLSDKKYGGVLTKEYTFRNDVEHEMGNEPLPNGTIRIFKENGKGLSFLGEKSTDYIPVGEKIEVPLGGENEIKVERVLWNYRKDNFKFKNFGSIRNEDKRVVGWDDINTYKTTLTNYKDKDVHIEIERVFGGDWEIDTSLPYEKVDVNTVKFEINLNARDAIEKNPFTGAIPYHTTDFTYTITTRQGENAWKKGE